MNLRIHKLKAFAIKVQQTLCGPLKDFSAELQLPIVSLKMFLFFWEIGCKEI